ncbi:MAG: cellulase family glycosylhydrolase [Solirubrobacterales bacterium]|nr:cellulase family glycosylhydrolase [Solirubrobacterales bacterium]
MSASIRLSRPCRLALVPILALLALVALLAVAAPRAEGARNLDIGFADNLYGLQSKSAREFKLTKTTNADIIRVNMYWSIVAPNKPAAPRDPADPAYDWTKIDTAISGAEANGFDVELTVTSAPPWAEGPNRPSDFEKFPAGSWRPDPAAFADFAHAVAMRYSGKFSTGGKTLPAIEYFEAWNEPNLSTYITPQWEGKTNVAADIYAKLLNAFYTEVKQVNPDAKIISGGTAPYGDPPGGPNRTQPIRFYQELLCLNTKNKKEACPNGEAPKFDIIAHHPINREDPPTAKADNKGDVEIADFGSLVAVVRAAEKQGTPATSGKHPVWANEVWWQTDPPDRDEGVSFKTHARWMAQSLYLLWKQGASNVTFLQFRDAKYTPGEFTLASYQTGVYTYQGRRKPSADAVAFPFVTDRQGGGLLAWGKAPASGNLTISAKAGGGYRKVTSFRVKAGQVFSEKLRLKGAGSQTLRASVGGKTSVPWVQK